MAASHSKEALASPVVARSDLVVELDQLTPSSVPVGARVAVFCIGSCFHRRQSIEKLEIEVDGERRSPLAAAMPRGDLAVRERAAYRSGFWATVPVRAGARPGVVELRIVASLTDGTEAISRLGQVEVVGLDPPASLPAAGREARDALIAICMATFEPDMKLFRAQVDSLRAQTESRWLCMISDDCSSPERFEQIGQLVAGDPRFVVSRSDERLGFYRNFERALGMVPHGVPLVAMCDQDDRWDPDKLETLRAALGDAVLAYSDLRLVDADGRVIRDTFWRGRRNNYRNLASELVVNGINGNATLFRRELLDVALPFPDGPGFLFHDHWIGIAAMATGRLAFVDRPLYDYVQHAGAVFGDVALGDRGASTRRLRARWRPSLKGRRGWFDRWRAAYFYGYLSRAAQARTLLIRSPERLSPRSRRVLERFVACEDSLVALAWLALRPLRCAVGRNETLGSEVDLVRGLLWRRLVAVRASRAQARGGRMAYIAGLPDPAIFEQPALRRWRARL